MLVVYRFMIIKWATCELSSITKKVPRACRQPRSPCRRASFSSRRAPPSGQEIFDEKEETEEDAPIDYREHPDSVEDEDTSEDAARNEDDE